MDVHPRVFFEKNDMFHDVPLLVYLHTFNLNCAHSKKNDQKRFPGTFHGFPVSLEGSQGK